MGSHNNPMPLQNTRIVELEAIGPVPFAGLVLAQLGAQVTLVSSPVARAVGIPLADDPLLVGRRRVLIDLKSTSGQADLHELLRDSDALIEGYRPGTLERLGLSPATLRKLNPKLVIARCGGWGEQSTRKFTAGHDINYLALSGLLSALGSRERPIPPLNLVGDFGGASMHLALGVVSAILAARTTGHGCVVDTSIFTSTLALSTHLHGLRRAGKWKPRRESNLLDGGAPFYRCYLTADAKWVAVGAIEPKFFRELLSLLGARIDPALQYDESCWPSIEAELARCFETKPQAAWDKIFAGSDACVTPVLELDEVERATEFAQGERGIPASGLSFSFTAPEEHHGH